MNMSMKKSVFCKIVGTAMLSAGIFLFTACPAEIGLGSAVDTAKPTVTISTPEPDSVVKEIITLSGTVTDDLEVKSVTVTFTSTSQPSLNPKSYQATVDKAAKTWSLVIDTKDSSSGLQDSNYEIIVTAADNTNKTSTASRSFQIDNTAPTVLITSPSQYDQPPVGNEDTNISTCCSQVDIEGKAYDASDIQSVKVYLCNGSGNVVAGPKTAEGTNTWFVRFAAEDLTGVQDGQVCYFYAVATDKSGNSNTYVYHQADIYSLPNGANPFPSMNDIGRLDQGTSASSSCKISAEDLRSIRLGTGAEAIASMKDTGKGYPDFIYQAQADAAVLWTNLGSTLQQSIIGVNTALFATIQPPTDNSAILLDSIQVQIRSKNGETYGDWIPQTSVTKQKVGESVNLSIVPKNEGQPLAEGTYEVHLRFKTNSNSEIPCDKEFLIQSDAPVVKETVIGTGSESYAQGTISENSTHKELAGIISRSNGSFLAAGDLGSDALVITCKNSSGSTVGPVDGYVIGSDIDYNEVDGSWKLQIPVGSETGAFRDDTYTFNITGALGEASTTITRVVVVDTAIPEVNLNSPTPDNCITIAENGTGFTIQGNATDTGSGIKTSYWCIDEAGAAHSTADTGIGSASVLTEGAVPENGKWYKFGTPTVFNLTPAMTGKEQTGYKLFVFTKDAAGHTSVVTEVPFFIDNAKPEISVTWPTLIRQNVNNMTISGKAWDSSGALENVYVSFDGGDAVEVQDVSSGVHANEAAAAVWTFPGSAVIPENRWTEGTHTLAFTVKDAAGRTSDVKTQTFTIDNVRPAITIANPANFAAHTSANDPAVLSDMVPISGTAIDTLSGLKENGITYSLDGGQTWTDVANQSGAWTITLQDNSGEDLLRINIKAEDKAGNTYQTGDIYFNIDKDNPQASILINDETTPSSDTFMTRAGFQLSGAANDAARTTGRQAEKAKLTYSKDGGNAVTVFDSETDTNTGCWQQVAGTWSWSTDTNFAEGFYTFTLTVTDKANKTTTATKSIRYDHTPPVLTVTSPAENEPFDSQTVNMSGNVSDSGIGVDKIYYTIDGEDPSVETTTFITPVGNSWSLSRTFEDQGVHTLKLLAADKLGNTTGVQTIHFSRDDAKPVLEELSVTANGKTTNAGFSLAGKTYDTNGLASISVTDGTTTWTGIGETGDAVSLAKKTSLPSSNNWSIDFVVGSTNSSSSRYIADGNTTFTITVTDVAGKTASVTRSVKVDTTKPSIEEPVVQSTLVKLDESAYNKLTVTASDSGTGLAGVWYQVLGQNAAAPSFDDENGWTALALNSSTDTASTWTGNIDFTGKAEGEHKIYVAAKDTAGNRIRYGESVSTGPVATSVVVDEKKPVITVTGLAEAAKADVVLTIAIDDTNPDAEALTAEVRTPSGTSLGNLTKTAAGSNTWKVTVPFSNSADETKPYYADGVYTIVVNEADTRGRNAATVTHTIRKDTTAPEINTIDNPATDKTGSEALYGSSFIFRGTAKDKQDNSACAGVTKILYVFTQSPSAPADLSAYTSLTVTDGSSWTITKTLEEGHNASAGALSEGKWFLYVLAEDKSGNRTATPAKREFDIDMKDPVLEITTPEDSSKTSYTATGSFTISGKATDTNGIAQNADGNTYVTVKVGTAAAVEVEVADDGTWTYPYSRTNNNKDQLLTATITATDMAGKSVIKSVPFFFDTQAPEITITKPAEGESIVVDGNGNYTLSGIATDLGIGIDTTNAKFTITDTAGQTVASGNLTVSGASWNTTVNFKEKAEGALTLKVTASDRLNQSASLTKNFYYDKADPELRVASVSASGLTTNAGFQLAGTAWDTNGLDCITVSDGTHTWTSAGDSPAITLIKKTSDPGNAAADRNWSINFVVGEYTGNEAPANWIADGTTIFTITAKDVAGKASSVTRTVTVDTTAPEITAVATEGTDDIPSGKVFLDISKYKKLTVTASDPDLSEGVSGTGLAGVYYQVVTGSTVPTFTSDIGWTSLALGNDGWTGDINFDTAANRTEEVHKIYVAAKDNAGNRKLYSEATEVTVDAKNPVTTIYGVADAKNQSVILSVIVEDTNPEQPVITVVNPKDDGSAGGAELEEAGLAVSDPEDVTNGKKWTVTIPFGNVKYNKDGIYTVVVNETDENGRVADEKTHTIRRDTTPPSATIGTPADNRTGANALFGDSYRFTGAAADNANGSGLAKILYAFTRSNTAPADNAWTELAVTDENWTVSRELTSGTATPPAGSLSEGTWYLHVIAEDKAGNRTATANRAIRMFDIDLNAPELGITKAGGKALTDLTKTNYTNSTSIKLEGTASDTNGVSSVSVKVGEESAAAATYYATAVAGHAAGTWEYTYNRTNVNTDQLLTATVTVTDVAGKTSVKTVPFYFDTQAPTVSITQPAPDALTSSNSYTISGTVADVGAGVATAKAKYEIKNGTETVAQGSLPITGANWSASVDLDDNGLTKKEGELTLTIFMEDALGNKVSHEDESGDAIEGISRVFYYDKTPPSITETEVGASLTTKNPFSFGGFASDTNALARDGKGAIQVSVVKGGTTVTTAAVDVAANGEWTKTFTPGESISASTLTDGTYNFIFTVTDVAGRTAMTTSTVTVDRKAPVIRVAAGSFFLTDTPVVLNSTTTPENWFNKEYLTLKAKVTDDAEGSVVTSGVSMVEYAVISNPESVPTGTDEAVAAVWKSIWEGENLSWSTMTMGSSSICSATVRVNNGTNYICIRATDVAGNVTYSTHETAYADLIAPTISGVYTDEDCTQGLTNNTYMTCMKDLKLYLKTSETGSGVKELNVTINGNTVPANQEYDSQNNPTDTYLLSVSAADLDAYLGTNTTITVSAVISDKAENSTAVSQLFTLQYDNTAPVITFTTPSEETTVNKTIKVSGTTNDDQSLESVKLYKGDFTGNVTPTDADKLADFTGNSRFNWTYTLNTFDSSVYPETYVAYSESMTLTVIAKDTAGNVKKEKLTFSVDQSTDRPQITINNIDFTDMSSTAPKWLIGNKTIYGSVTDDDGLIKKLEIKEEGTNWKELTVNNGSFTTIVKENGVVRDYLEDGNHTILFRITDRNDTVFTVTAQNILEQPVLKDNDDTPAGDNKLYVTIDTLPPSTAVSEFSFNGADWDSNLLSNTTFGKVAEYNTFYVRQYVYDKNGIQSVEVSIDSNSYRAATPVMNAGQPLKKTIGGVDYVAYQYKVTTDQISEAESGIRALNIRVTDKAGMNKDTSASFSVDNDAPVITVTSHSDGDRVQGSIFLAGTSSDVPSFTGAASIAYKVTASEMLSEDEDWTDAHDVKGSNLSAWRIYFDNDVNNTTDFTHDKALKKILVSVSPYNEYLKISSNDDETSSVVYSKNYTDSQNITHKKDDLYKDITTLYVHFKATDSYGNTSYTVRSLELDPQGDIPSVEITYPGATAYRWRNAENGSEYFTAGSLPEQGDSAYTSLVNVSDDDDPVSIQAINRTARTITVNAVPYTFVGGESVQGGIVRLQGIAEDEKAIEGVFIQIDPTYNPAEGFKWDDKNPGSELMPYGTTSAEKRPENTNLGSKYPITAIGDSGKKGILVGTSGTWSISLNDSGEFNGIKLEGDEESGNNYVAVRAIALDKDGNISPYTDIIILTIDADTPRIGASEELYLYQYENNEDGTGAVLASQKYTDDMWLKGEWWLEGSVEDSNGIVTLKIDDDSAEGKAIGNQKWQSGNNETSGYKLKFKIGNAQTGLFGKEEHKISAVDKDNKSAQKIIHVNYDNKAPELALKESANYRISSTVVQSNGFYTLGSSVTENSSETASQSGFERVAVYFTRTDNNSDTSYLYDTFNLKNTEGNKTALSQLTSEEGLYWKTLTVSRNDYLLSELTLSAADPNVHAGGLVKLGGAIYRIKSVNDRTVIIEGSPEARYTDAKFALAQIVDHTLTESNGVSLGSNGYYSDVMNDDGDCMVESVTRQGATTVWEANINSRNIPDGAIEIHYVVFDKAGNYAEGVVENAMVANNAPRLAGVLYGTDDNGDGIVKDNELKKDPFAIDKANGNGYIRSSLVSSYVLGTKTVNQDSTVHLDKVALKIKGGIAVVPEIVGGNGDLFYSLSVTKDGEKEPYYVKAAEKWMKTDSEGKSVQVMGTDYTAQQNGPASEIISDAAIRLSLNDLLRKNNEGKAIADDSDAKRLFTFTIWDSTEGLIPGETSQKAVIEMVSALNLKDKNKPVPTVNPFYWTNETTNSVYKNGKALMGHIDLKADLPDSFTDRHDKVSGKIVIEGTVKDDIQLESLYMKIFTGSSDTETDAFTFKTSDTSTADTVTIGNKAFYKVASYAAGKWTSESHLNDYGWAFSVGSETFSQDEGHTATWQLVLDTEKLDKAVVNDLKVAIMAKDLGSPTLTVVNDEEVITWIGNDSELPSDSTSNLTVFDVVPYITELETTINNAQTNNTRLFNRSALGLYPVRRGETVTIKGYNLKVGSTAPVVKLGDKKPTVKESSVSQIKFTVGNDNKTGDLTVTVLDGKTELASTLNNMHDNNVEYNREANGVTNNLLTDARKLYVWSISNVVENSQVRYPSFAVGSDNSQSVAFVYGSGTQDILMKKNGTEFSIDKSATQWYDTAVAIDSKGRMYGAAMNGAGGGAKEGNIIFGKVEVNQGNGGYGNFGFYAWNTSNNPGKIYQKESGLFGRGDRWLDPSESEYNTYSSGYKKVCLENASNGTKADTNRVLNPKIAVDNDGNAIIAYYDQLSGQVRFRYGSVSEEPDGNEQLTFSGGLGNHNNKNGGSAANYQIIAGSGAGRANTNRAGEYVAVGLVPSRATGAGTAVVAWCDGQNLYYSYNMTPGTVDNDVWADNTTVIDSDLAGWYVDMDVDKAGGIHIAYYASSNGDLRYAYLPGYDQAGNKQVVTVDSYSTTGSYISVKASEEMIGGKYVPYISYFVESFKRTSISNRVAWPVTLADGKFTAGALDEKFTGSWEVMTIPTDQTPTEYTVGVGIKKNDAGVNKPILGYGTTDGIQTAQLQ